MTTFIDGSRIKEGCKCESGTPLPDGRERRCDMPCWQRYGMVDTPCCPDCAPLPKVDGSPSRFTNEED